MPPATGPALIILVAFVLPGFVTVLIQEATFRRAEDPTTLDRLLRILYYSVWTYLLLAVVALLLGVDRAYVEGFYEQNEGNPAELVWRAALLILIPAIIIATVTRAWYGSKVQACVLKVARINEHHSEPTGWDFFFRQSRDAYVRVTFRDGGRVYGYYGGKSFSAYAKDGGDLFLERVHADVDDWFGPVANNSCGIWVKTEDAVSVEFYDAEHAASATTERESPGSETTEGNGSQTAAQAAGGKPAKEGLADG